MRGTLIIIAFATALLFGAETRGQTANSVTLAWNPSSSTGVTGYYVYYGTDTNINDMTAVPVSANATNITINGLVSGQTYYFAAASHDANFNTSDPSPVVSTASAVAATGVLSALVGLPTGQFGFMLTSSGNASAQYIVQASTDLVHWVALQTNTGPFQFVDSNTAGFSRRFYRTVSISN
ncbi:MAG TPA: fibronectin type III domain-containing protein [Verrucomicrobiae bacterium]|nr:fibronectin type III domain-containing protein [Verrucomicrobiae bacterium]